jgi:hypothetical protein
MAWVAGSLAVSVHQIVVQHAVCAEHGEVFELADAADHQADGSTLRADLSDTHEHDCDFDVLALDPIPTVSAAAPGHFALHRPKLAAPDLAQAPRGPPLAYAPKTSPPPTC